MTLTIRIYKKHERKNHFVRWDDKFKLLDNSFGLFGHMDKVGKLKLVGKTM